MNGSEPVRPVLGLTTYLDRAQTGVWDVRASFLPVGYFQDITAAGGIAVLLPPQPVDREIAVAKRAAALLDVRDRRRGPRGSHGGSRPLAGEFAFNTPPRGFGQSGLGREPGAAAPLVFTETKKALNAVRRVP